MKFNRTGFLVLCLAGFLSCKKDPATSSNNVQLTNGLVLYYPFNGNTNDASGNANNGMLVNGSQLAHDENGRAQSALNLTGNGQKMVVQNNGKLNFDTDLTVSFHAMPRTINRSNIIGMAENSSGKGISFVVGPALPGNSNFIYSISDNDVPCNTFQTSTQVSNIDAGITLQPESWYHIICSYSKGTMKLYINGALISTRVSNDNTMRTCPNSQLLIGGWVDQDPGATFNGKIDEVRLYNRELHVDEIKELSKSFN